MDYITSSPATKHDEPFAFHLQMKGAWFFAQFATTDILNIVGVAGYSV
jgi:hypothetical protein